MELIHQLNPIFKTKYDNLMLNKMVILSIQLVN